MPVLKLFSLIIWTYDTKVDAKEVCYQLVKQVMYSSTVLFPNVWATCLEIISMEEDGI
jgi:hypothetical protein